MKKAPVNRGPFPPAAGRALVEAILAHPGAGPRNWSDPTGRYGRPRGVRHAGRLYLAAWEGDDDENLEDFAAGGDFPSSGEMRLVVVALADVADLDGPAPAEG
jgi:hypothetical protein